MVSPHRPPHALPLELGALVGDEAVVWSSRPLRPGERLEGVTLEGGTVELEAPGARGWWWDSPLRLGWRVVDAAGEELAFTSGSPVQLFSDGAGPLLLDPDQTQGWALSWPALPPDGPQVALYLVREEGVGRFGASSLGHPGPDQEPLASAEEQGFTVEITGRGLEHPQRSQLRAVLALRGSAGRPLAQAERELVETGLRVVWGDLHSHSNLSMDACEHPDEGCGPVDGTPGVGSLSRAADNGLDFVALTEHAEHSTYNHEALGLCLDIWSESQALVQASEGGQVLGLLGYEWTSLYDGGGHRTVIFDQTVVCENMRVSGVLQRIDVSRSHAGELFEARGEAPTATTPAQLEEVLREAASTCGVSRWVAYFHHPAVTRPRGVDWSAEANQGLADAVVEIYSEHGSSECSDLAAEGCGWRVNTSIHDPDGSVQRALELGFTLGFVGGTDNHEADPGGLHDDPSYTYGILGRRQQFAQGGLTGLWVPSAGELTRAEVLDALGARQSLAASMPLERVQAVLVDQQGGAYLPGAVLGQPPVGARLLVSVEDEAAVEVLVELVAPQGEVLVSAPGPYAELPVPLDQHPVVYTRLRILDADGVEQRVWLSPWFVSP